MVLFAPGRVRWIQSRRTARWCGERLLSHTAGSAYVGFCPAEVLYSGSAPGLIGGTIQGSLRIPAEAPPPAPAGVTCGVGEVPVLLLFGGVPGQETVTISVR